MGKTVAKSESLNIQLEIQYPFKKKKTQQLRITGTMIQEVFES